VWGTIVAVEMLAVAVAGLTQLGAPFYVENLFNGAMLVLAIGLAVATQKRRERRRAREADTRAAAQRSPRKGVVGSAFRIDRRKGRPCK
jgi:ribose transport system permease protein